MSSSSMGSTKQAPPHTRGSTRAWSDAEHAAFGSPAHAGIDPCASTWARAAPRLPRTRGDRPIIGAVSSWVETAPPHTRGSTLDLAIAEEKKEGSPAHAGIDRCQHRFQQKSHWLPRTRGDRPERCKTFFKVSAAPPHTRGSTRRSSANIVRSYGSPAHAGIDPVPPCTACSRNRLPRTRGDRPRNDFCHQSAETAPPHTRGSTLLGAGFEFVVAGSPAHAGIDPHPRALRADDRGLPRTRGDRPASWTGHRTAIPAPPHTRGSTFTPYGLRYAGIGSPAHAGIDPSAPTIRWCSDRLPRTRGDRPW